MLTQAGAREGYSSHNWDVQGVPTASEAGVKLQEPEVSHLFSQGSWPQFTGPSAVAGCTGCRKGVGSDLPCIQDLWQQRRQPLGSEITAAARACIDVALPSVSTQSGKLLWWAQLSPPTPRNKGLLPLWQTQPFSRTPSRLAVAC